MLIRTFWLKLCPEKSKIFVCIYAYLQAMSGLYSRVDTLYPGIHVRIVRKCLKSLDATLA